MRLKFKWESSLREVHQKETLLNNYEQIKIKRFYWTSKYLNPAYKIIIIFMNDYKKIKLKVLLNEQI